MWDMAPLVLIITADRYKGFLELKKMLFQAGCCGYGGISCFFHVGQAQPSVRVRSCRMWFHLMKVLFLDAWMANKNGAGGITIYIRTSVCVALIFERAEGTKPGPPPAARTSSSMHGPTPDGGSLL